MATFVMTVIGDDRPGLVAALATPISEHGGSWERSQLARLEGKFAGIVLATAPDASYAALTAELEALQTEGLRVVVERTDEAPEREQVRLGLQLLGADRPGIVAEISAVLAEREVSIVELSTDVRDAPMAGGTLFEARAVLLAPAASSTDELRTRLEALADELLVDLALSDG